jgi:hypothetical protein
VKASRTDYSRLIDWSKVASPDRPRAMRKQVLRFVGGIRGERKGEVTGNQIRAWFHGTPAAFVDAAICSAVSREELNVCRTALGRSKANERYVYELTDKGRASLRSQYAAKQRTPYEDAWERVASVMNSLEALDAGERRRFFDNLIDEAEERRDAINDGE